MTVRPNPSSSARERAHTGVRIVVAAYAAAASLWILLSDRAVGTLFRDQDTLVRVNVAKGWLFVAVTSLLLHALLRRLTGALEAVYERELAFERERHQPSAMLAAIADSSVDAIFAKDVEGRYVLCNNAAARFVGRSVDDVVGKDDRAFFLPEEAERLMAIDRQTRESGRVHTSEASLHAADGDRVTQTTIGPLRDADGTVFGTYGISRDVTARRRAADADRRVADDLSATLQAIPDLMFELDAEGRYIKVKTLHESLLAAPPEQLIGRTVHDVLPPDAVIPVMQAIAAARTSGSDFGRTMTLDLDGHIRHFELSVARKPKVEGAGERFIMLSRDITARKVAEIELRQRNQELERFNRAATERELRMVALKEEVNALSRALDRPAPYDTSFADPAGSHAAP